MLDLTKAASLSALIFPRSFSSRVARSLQQKTSQLDLSLLGQTIQLALRLLLELRDLRLGLTSEVLFFSVSFFLGSSEYRGLLVRNTGKLRLRRGQIGECRLFVLLGLDQLGTDRFATRLKFSVIGVLTR
jgi:hypothetical protein